MGAHRIKPGKNQRLARKAARRRDAEAAAQAGAKLSATNTYFPSPVSEAAKAFGVNKSEQGEGLNVVLRPQKRAKKPKKKITQGQIDDLHRRLKLLELHVEAAANIFNKLSDDHKRDFGNLTRNFAAACADGRAIRSMANDAMAGMKNLEAGMEHLEALVEDLTADVEGLSATSAEHAQTIAKAHEDHKAEMKAIRERISAIERQVEQLVKGAVPSAAQWPAGLPKDGGARGAWKGRLRSGKKG